MSEWSERELSFDDPLSSVEELLRMAADDVPVVRSGLKTEIVTKAQNVQRNLRGQQILWGGVLFVVLLIGGLAFWPGTASRALASSEEGSEKPAAASIYKTFDAIDWELVEAKTQLRRRNLEIIRNAF